MKGKILGYAIGPIGSGILGLISLPLLTWFYSVEDIGRISLLQVAADFSIMIFCLGLDQAYMREYHESHSKPSLFKQSIIPGLIFMCVVLAFIYFFNPTYLSFLIFDISDSVLSLFIIFFFILLFFARFLSLILRMDDRAIAYSMSQLLPKLIFVMFVVISVIFDFEKDIYNLSSAHILSLFLVFLFFAWNTRKEWLQSILIKFDKSQSMVLLRFGFPLVVGGLASWGLSMMDRIFLRSMSTFEELGVYSVSMSVAGVALVFSGIFNTIWMPLVYRWVNDGVDIKKINNISNHVLAALFFAIVLCGMFSWIIPYFLPANYEVIRHLLVICLIGPLLYTLSETTVIGISIARKTSFSMLASIGAALVNLIGNYVLVQEYGAIGAATSTAIAFFVFYILRTEFSILVWEKIPRFKSYLIIFLVISCSISAAIVNLSDINSFLLWCGLFFLGFFVFKNNIRILFLVIKKNVIKY